MGAGGLALVAVLGAIGISITGASADLVVVCKFIHVYAFAFGPIAAKSR